MVAEEKLVDLLWRSDKYANLEDDLQKVLQTVPSLGQTDITQ